ncbi:MAG: UvrD-helicase domain-containing protein [Anaerolineaceae bacterium]|nr:UvrD-helicase domain-containing protein [Anaerolineaceae bacterium]
MTDPRILKVLKAFDKLNDEQREAVLERGRDVAVTAGAGSGKTYTLVARYTTLLAEGIPPRQIAAITFTKKAALEMRSKVRDALVTMQVQSIDDGEERQRWADLSAQMDAARIGTIHSLCTEILRAHPAEAGIDPRFEVLDEGVGKAYQSQAVEDTLKNLVSQDHFLPLLQNFELSSLKDILKTLLEKRLESMEVFQTIILNRKRLAQELQNRLSRPEFQEPLRELKSMSESTLIADGGDKLADILTEVKRLWMDADSALESGDPVTCAAALYDLRRNQLTKTGGTKGSVSKSIYDELKRNFDLYLNPLTGGKDSKDEPPSVETEVLFEQLLPLLREAFEAVHKAYQDFLENDQALDFDDLEYKAQKLLQSPEIRAYWQGELQALLVDEFQDTNRRQQEIVRALTGAPGHLFIVGDPRQSIYRFRKADVTVFKAEEDRIKSEEGRVIELKRTYRAHAPLLDATGNLLDGVINADRPSTPDYYIPFTPMMAHRTEPDVGYKSPHVEFVLGVGEDADSARPLMAKALAARLLELKDEKQFDKWDEVALLFRASTGFPFYEEAFEEAGIPFVTVAGKGFYDRPEIRDLMNILRALADPLDDLAFAGLLRSPAFGLTDAALYLLRQSDETFWTALQGDLLALSEADQIAAKRARDICVTLMPMVDRIPVAELLKQVLDALDYRALLATADSKGSDTEAKASGGRLWRNVDKLLIDARKTGQVSVRSFLDTLETLNDAGAREGEAPAEADGSVVLMTIHKSKGLEYPVVVLADAGRTRRGSSENVYLFNELGVTFKLDQPPMLYKLARELDRDQESCEDLRLLYVALTRARSKLLISTHCKMNEKGEIKLDQWAKELVGTTGVQSTEFVEAESKPFEFQMTQEHPLRVWCTFSDIPLPMIDVPVSVKDLATQSDLIPLYQPVEGFLAETTEEVKGNTWQVTWHVEDVPGNVLGSMVHKAIQRWLFPSDLRLTALLEMVTINAGLTSERQRLNATDRATELLARLRRQPIWEEINSAQDRYSELPYTYTVAGRMENRVIDLLYQNSNGWQLIDFKTDPILTHSYKDELVQVYAPQVKQYADVVESKLGHPVQARICFLDNQSNVELVVV